jgi:hypothetical protein
MVVDIRGSGLHTHRNIVQCTSPSQSVIAGDSGALNYFLNDGREIEVQGASIRRLIRRTI